MATVYLVCAIAGGTLIVCQFVLTLFGLGGDHGLGGHDMAGHDLAGHDLAGHDVGGHGAPAGSHEVGHGSEPNWFFGMLTFRTLTAAIAFFGLAGLAATRNFDEAWVPLAIAILAGASALVAVAKLMALMSGLNVDGTVRIERALGAKGTVYLGIPGNRAGAGKVHVNVLSRTLEYNAVTTQDPLPTGASIVVVSVVNADTVEVASCSAERASHA